MKKLAASLVAAAAMTAGVLTMSTTGAHAAYPGGVRVDTHAKVPAHVAPHHRATVRVTLNTAGVTPAKGKAHVVFLVRRAGSGHLVARTTHDFKKHLTFHTPKLHRGNFYVIVKVVTTKGTVYQGSYERHKLHVG